MPATPTSQRQRYPEARLFGPMLFAALVFGLALMPHCTPVSGDEVSTGQERQSSEPPIVGDTSPPDIPVKDSPPPSPPDRPALEPPLRPEPPPRPEPPAPEPTPDLPALPEPGPEPPADKSPGGCQQLFCDGFEGYSSGGLPGALWRQDVSGQAAIDIDTNKAHTGKHSLRFRINQTSYSNRALAFVKSFPKTKLFYARAWVWIDQLPKDGHHTTLFATGGQATKQGVYNDQPFEVAMRYGIQQQTRLMANFDTPGGYSGKGPKSDCWRHSSKTFPANKWVCMEWYYDATQKKSSLWMDGQEVIQMGTQMQGCLANGVDPQKKEIAYPKEFEVFQIGYVTYQGGDSSRHQMWVDDLAIGKTRIGCQ